MHGTFNVRFVSYNIKGLSNNQKLGRLFLSYNILAKSIK